VAQGFKYTNITTNTTTTVKSGAGVLHSVSVNTKGATETAQMYDNTAGSGTKIGLIDVTLTQDTLIYDLQFQTGLTIVTAGTTPADITVAWL
jgi:hypothetical protein